MTGPEAQLIAPELFYGEPVSTALLNLVDEHLSRRFLQRLPALQVAASAWELRLRAQQGKGLSSDDPKLVEQVSSLFAGVPSEKAPDRDIARPVGPLIIPTTHSCTFLNGAYLQWQKQASATFPELLHPAGGLSADPSTGSVIVDTATPRAVDARVVIGGGAGNIAIDTVGVTSWVTLGSTGPAHMTAEIYLNAHDYVFTALFGGGEGVLTVGGFVAEILDTGLRVHWHGFELPVLVEIPESTTQIQLADITYEGFERWDMERQTVQLSFPGVAGATYACTVWVQVAANALGATGVSAEINAIVDPIEVCQ